MKEKKKEPLAHHSNYQDRFGSNSIIHERIQ